MIVLSKMNFRKKQVQERFTYFLHSKSINSLGTDEHYKSILCYALFGTHFFQNNDRYTNIRSWGQII